MRSSTLCCEPDSGLSITQAIRELAVDARAVLNGEADPCTVREVLLRIDELRDESLANPSAPILGWLDSLRRQVQDA